MAYQKLDEKLIKEWNREKNVDLDPRNLNVPAKTKLWWICENGHEWMARLDHRKRGAGCPYDSGHRLLPSNSLAITHPQIAVEWHPHKNGKITPLDVSRATQVFLTELEEAIAALIAVAKFQHQKTVYRLEIPN